MTEELDILRIIAESPFISQRRIAEQIGISLGQVNFLIKKFAKKGLIKIEGQTSKSIMYNLTPRGIAEKAALTLEYVKISYSAVIVLTDKIRALAEHYEGQHKKIYVCGSGDEMMEICKLALKDKAIYFTSEPTEINFVPNSVALLYWEDERISELELCDVEAVNILL